MPSARTTTARAAGGRWRRPKPLCAARRLRLTPARAFVLENAARLAPGDDRLRAPRRLAEAGLGSQPPVVYRALDFLVANGFAHRIERLGAFAACTHAGPRTTPASWSAAPAAASPRPRSRAPRGAHGGGGGAGFAIERTVVEAEGLCARCREAGA